MRELVVKAFVSAGFLLAIAACTDDGEKLWSTPAPAPPPPAESTTASSASSSSTSSSSTSSSSTTGGMGGMGGTGGMAGSGGMAGMGGAGGAGGAGGSAAQNPKNLTATIVGKDVQLAWEKSSKPTSRIVRKEGLAPTGPDDPAATIVYEGTAGQTTEALRGLMPSTTANPRTYHYAVYGCDGSCSGDPAAANLSPTLAQALKGGGYNIFWRHASADVCADQTNLGTAANNTYANWWKRCDDFCPGAPMTTATARQLNAAGVTESIAIGEALKTRGIPIGRLLSSEFCRCLKTAELMQVVPTAMIEQRADITLSVYDEANRCANSTALLAEEPPTGANTGLVSHAGFTGNCPTLGALVWGEAAIYKPNGAGGSTLIQRVLWSEWATLP